MALIFASAWISNAQANEGLWQINRLPLDRIRQETGVSLQPDLLARALRATLRTPGWCTSVFVSKSGLALTNYHCLRACLSQHSTAVNGYLAASRDKELACSGLEIDQLLDITDVTQKVADATAAAPKDQYTSTRDRIISNLEADCSNSILHCQVVSFPDTNAFDLYKYRIFHDVRLVFAPEEAAENARVTSSGELINFDMAFLRIYDGGKPLDTSDAFLTFTDAAPVDGEPIFVFGNPFHTYRHATLAEVRFDREVKLPQVISYYDEYREYIAGYEAGRPDKLDVARPFKYVLDVSLIDNKFAKNSVSDDALLGRRQTKEAELLLRSIFKQPDSGLLNAKNNIAELLQEDRQLYPFYFYLESRAFDSVLFNYARDLVRLFSEKAKPDDERMQHYHERDVPDVVKALGSDAPIDKDFEIAKLSFSLRKLSEDEHIDDSMKNAILGDQSPEQLARFLVNNTTLTDAHVRSSLVNAGEKGVSASTDPMVAFVRDKVEPIVKPLKSKYEALIGDIFRQRWEINRTRRALSNEPDYPDATGTLRVSYGRVEGKEGKYKSLSGIGAAFAKHVERDRPGDIPASWVNARKELDQNVVMTVLSSTDAIGGNSGSAVTDKSGRVLAVLSGGTGSDQYYEFLPDWDRSISIASSGIIHLLQKAYHADSLTRELLEWNAQNK
jgi:hypothetical protein